MTMQELIEQLREFARERDWEQFHTPKNLSMALSVEVAEVVELFQWLKCGESGNLPSAKLEALREEIGDVLIYLAALADKFGIDPLDAAREKLEINRRKYPAGKVRGRFDKYTDY
jgi:dCTP diphosphatase